MAVYTKRVQAVLTEEQYELLSRLSVEQGKSLSALIREAIGEVYFQQAHHERRRAVCPRAVATNCRKCLARRRGPSSRWGQRAKNGFPSGRGTFPNGKNVLIFYCCSQPKSLRPPLLYACFFMSLLTCQADVHFLKIYNC